MPLAIIGAGLLAVVLVVASIFLLRRAEEDPLSNRIDQYAANPDAEGAVREPVAAE